MMLQLPMTLAWAQGHLIEGGGRLRKGGPEDSRIAYGITVTSRCIWQWHGRRKPGRGRPIQGNQGQRSGCTLGRICRPEHFE